MIRTELQRESDSIDCELYRLIVRAERLWDAHRGARTELHQSLQSLRSARIGLRMCMHPDDAKTTRGY